MSRSRKHKSQHSQGIEWGAKRIGDKGYRGIPCSAQKKRTSKAERRRDTVGLKYELKHIVPGSIKAKQNGGYLEVKESLRYSWELGRPIVISNRVENAARFGEVTLSFCKFCV